MNPESEASIGVYYPPAELGRIIVKDMAYYRSSGGGVTFSGGEPLIFCRYLEKTSRHLEEMEIHTVVETSGFFDWAQFSLTMKPYTDLILFDLKIYDSVKHQEYTGQRNNKIMENLRKILEEKIPLQVRIPLIPGITATEENLEQWALFIKDKGIENVRLLPYNPSGIEKWKRLGKQPPKDLREQPLTLEEERRWNNFFQSF
jgi:pyruvate formate lyase activating enzyme